MKKQICIFIFKAEKAFFEGKAEEMLRFYQSL